MRVQFYSGAARSSAHLSFHQWSGALKCRCWRERSELLRRDRCSLKCRRRIHASPISSAASWSKAGVISGSRSLMPSGPVAIALLRRSVCFVPGLVWMHTIAEIRWLWKMQKRSIHPNHHYLYALMGVLFFCLLPASSSQGYVGTFLSEQLSDWLAHWSAGCAEGRQETLYSALLYLMQLFLSLLMQKSVWCMNARHYMH